MPTLNFLALSVPEIYRDPECKKVCHVTASDLFDQILHFSLVPMVVNLRAKFEVSSIEHS